jgi:arylesterase/paraoxonase
MIKKALLASLVIIILICAGGGIFLYSAVNRDIDEHFAGQCSELNLDGSGEDMQMDAERGFLYLSVFDRQATAKGEVTGPGSIQRIDLDAGTLVAENALLSTQEHMHPHGISLYIDADGQRHFFMINHPEDRDTGKESIERFIEESPGNYRHIESFSDPLITRANDLVATGPRQFYVAQDTERGTGQTVTNLVYFDGENYSVVADDIASGGGINVSADNSTLYIAETNGKAVRVATRNNDGGIETLARIDVGTSPDNINVAEDGSLIVGAHSNLIALVMHFIVGSDAPSQILRIDSKANPPLVEEIYLNAGEQISAGSGAIQFGDRLLIGSITDKKILVCKYD